MMAPEELMQLISKGESLNVEFKGEEGKPLSDDELVKAVVCLANRPSSEIGYILVGVEDDGRITGARPRHGGWTDPIRIQALVANRTRPSITCQVCVVPMEDKEILVIEVPPSREPVGTADGIYLQRTIGGRGKPECRPFHFHEMQSMLAHRGILDYSKLPIPEACWEDLDSLEFERFRRFVRESRGQGDTVLLELSDLEVAKALGAVEVHSDESISIRALGLLLFGKEEALRRFIPTHEVAFQVFSGEQVETNEFFHYPILRTMEAILSRYRARNKEKELMVGLLRVSVPDYSERAFREAVANALIHRDYTRLGAVHIQWYPDRIEISNPGGFPEGVHLGNILVTPPRPRNPLLADAFKRAGIVERTGRGIDIIFAEQLRNGRPAPSYERSTSTDVILVLPGGEANLTFVRLVVEQNQAQRPLGLNELLLLNYLWQERRLTTQAAASLIQRSETEARAVLERLVEAGILEARGERKGRSYHLSAATYRLLGEKAAYVRTRGFDFPQMVQMLLQYAKAHGRITRKEAAELCQIREYQASYLLKRLVQEGKLALHGRRRGSYYTPTEPK